MAEHVHVHPPEDLVEPSETSNHSEHRLELVAIFLMAIATVGIAWSGYQAASWSGEQAQRYAKSNTEHERATRIATLGNQDRQQDLEQFDHWLEATSKGDAALATMFERRFRREFRPAFEAWLAEDPFGTGTAPPSPLFEEEYHPAHDVRAHLLEIQATQDFEAGKTATENSDDFVFITVLFAAVLFFGGISLRFGWARLRLAVLILGLVFLGFGLFEMSLLPLH